MDTAGSVAVKARIRRLWVYGDGNDTNAVSGASDDMAEWELVSSLLLKLCGLHSWPEIDG